MPGGTLGLGDSRGIPFIFIALRGVEVVAIEIQKGARGGGSIGVAIRL